jgi:hypothetical protein
MHVLIVIGKWRVENAPKMRGKMVRGKEIQF